MNVALHDLWVLTQLRVRLLLRSGIRNYSRDARSAAPLRLIGGAVIVLWVGGTLIVPLTATAGVAYSGPNGLAEFTNTTTLLFSAVSLLIFFYAVLGLVNALTGGGDLRLLLLAPISPRLIAGFKIGAVSIGFTPLLLFGVPGLLAAGQALHFGAAYVIGVLLMVLIVPAPPVALAALLVLAVVRKLPPARAKSVTTTLGVILGAALFIGYQLVFGLGRSYSSTATAPSATLPEWLPTTWAARGLIAFGDGQSGTAVLYLGATLLLAAVLTGLAVELAARLIATGSAGYAEVARRRRRTAAPVVTAEPSRRLTRWISWLPVLHKDWLTFRRDPQRLATLVYPLLIVAFYFYRLVVAHSVFAGAESPSSPILSGALFGILVFSAVVLIGPTAATIVNREGNSLYLLALAPMPVRDLFLAKWTFVAAPVVVVIEAILTAGAILVPLDPGRALLGGIVLAAVVVALSGAALTINLIWPKFESSGTRRQGSAPASFGSFVADLAIGGVSCALLIASLALGPDYWLISTVLVLAIFALTGGCALLALRVGTRVLTNLLTGDRRPR